MRFKNSRYCAGLQTLDCRRPKAIDDVSMSINFDRIVKSPKPVTPKAGVHNQLKILDCGLRHNDDYDEIRFFTSASTFINNFMRGLNGKNRIHRNTTL